MKFDTNKTALLIILSVGGKSETSRAIDHAKKNKMLLKI